MQASLPVSGWRLYVFAPLIIGSVLASLLRLDEIVFRCKSGSKRGRKLIGQPPMGRPEFSDPDGRAWKDLGRGQGPVL